MDISLDPVVKKVYDKCNLEISLFSQEVESKEYAASQFMLNGQNVISRTAKVTPKKLGQFVTFWKRNQSGIIEPFNDTDPVDFYVIDVKTQNRFGQFVFPKSVLIDKGLISTSKKDGKRGFRVYPEWDVPNNQQAKRTQNWQLKYFYEINESINYTWVKKMFE